MPELGADPGSGKHDGAARPRDRSGKLGNFSIDGHAGKFGKCAATRQARRAILAAVSIRTAYLAAEGFAEELDHELGGRRHEARPPADRLGAAAARGMGRECLARPAGDRDRLDFGCGRKAAGDPAQLGGLCASPLPARDADPGAAAESLGQAARLRDTAADGPARIVDPARCRDDARGAALHEPVSQWRDPFRRGSHRARRAAPI